jgi:cellulose synthase/poly-beta-1,6-N-acetylglucosamine synthase-like glycosyltransferase
MLRLLSLPSKFMFLFAFIAFRLTFSLPALLLTSRGLGPYLRQHFLDKTFQGLYQVNAFDLALLIPYFIVLIILAAYGGHRYWLVYLYYKHKKNKTTEPPAHFEDLPRVTVQLPIFNEQYVVDRLLDAVCRLDYPREKLDIQLLDDSTDETVEVARQLVERYAALGHPVTYHHRDNRHGFKAGALAEGLKTAKGEFVAIYDADFVPPPDFLLNCIHHFTDPHVGMVQTRWTHINRS